MLTFISIVLMSTCVCEVGVCCDGCQFVKKNKPCLGEPLQTFYKCTGNLCGVSLQVTHQYFACDGASSACPFVKKTWSPLEVVDECTFAELCAGGGSEGYCYADPLCCVPNCANSVCGDDGCGGSCGICPSGFGCVGGACVEQKGTCAVCGVDEECADGHVCMGYEDFGMCLPADCVLDDDCPPGLDCTWVSWADMFVCWVEKAGTTCISDDVWYVNTCGVPYVTFTDCSMWESVCFEGACCKPHCREAQCGDDGCGGECGTCDFEQACIAGMCSECIPGAVEDSVCQGLCGTRQRVCGPYGVWGEWSSCAIDLMCVEKIPIIPECVAPACEPGDALVEECGACGERIIVCDIDCQWHEGLCTQQGECVSGSVRECEVGEQTCTQECQWEACLPLALVDLGLAKVRSRSQGSLIQDVPRDVGCYAGTHGGSVSCILLLCVVLFGIKVS